MAEAIIGIIIAMLLFIAVNFKKSKIKKASAAVRTSAIALVVPNGNINSWNETCDALDLLIKKHPWRAKTLAKLIADCLKMKDGYGDSFRIDPYSVIREKFGEETQKDVKRVLENFKKTSFLRFEEKPSFFEDSEVKRRAQMLKGYRSLTKDQIEEQTTWFASRNFTPEALYFLSEFTKCPELRNLCNLKYICNGGRSPFLDIE